MGDRRAFNRFWNPGRFNKSVRFNLDVLGSAETILAFKFLGERVRKRVYRAALKKATTPILEEAKRRVPVNTGALYWNIKLRMKSGKTLFQTTAVVETPTRKRLNLSPEGGYYPASLEFGWRTKSGTKIPPRAYMRPAFHNNKGLATRIFKEQMRIGVEKSAKRAKNKFMRKAGLTASRRRRIGRSFRRLRRRLAS